jgi:hypothetical protein
VGNIVESSATEKAILKMAHKFGIDYNAMRNEHLKDNFIRF